MSEFKFACPVCGQHITCDSAESGARLDCPTCFQQLIVPQPPAGADAKFLLTAALASSRQMPQSSDVAGAVALPAPVRRKLPLVILAIVIVLVAVAGLLFAFRGKIFKRPSPDSAGPLTGGAVNAAAWKSDLAGVRIPDTPLAGRISGAVLDSPRAILEGGTLMFRQGRKETAQLGFTIALSEEEGEKLAGRDISVGEKDEKPPKVVLSRKDDPNGSTARLSPRRYMLRLQFGEVSNGRLPGKIYFCAFDPTKSWITGTFEAELRKKPTPKPKPPGPPRPPR